MVVRVHENFEESFSIVATVKIELWKINCLGRDKIKLITLSITNTDFGPKFHDS
jgi:hypothetical protein